MPTHINNVGGVVGYISGKQLLPKAVARTEAGDYTTVTMPVKGQEVVQVLASINDNGVSVGYAAGYDCLTIGGPCSYIEADGFTYALGGSPSIFAVNTTSQKPTFATAINNSGTVTGYYDSFNIFIPSAKLLPYYGFIRDQNGVITTIKIPGYVNNTPMAINDSGLIAGTATDSNNLASTFVRIP